MRFNPFRPGSIVSPGMFCGRGAEVIAIEQSLFQTKNGNPAHFLIEGERGIGKSSLMLYVNLLATNQLVGSEYFNFISLQIELNDVDDDTDIVRKIGMALKRELIRSFDIKAIAKGIYDWVINWNVLGVEYKKDKDGIDSLGAMEDLADLMARVIKDAGSNTLGALDGILVLIDEADAACDTANLGRFLKLFTERLSKRECDRVCFGLAGLPSLVPKLKDGHESSPRIFQDLNLQPLRPEERREVVRRGLVEANAKNETETKIDESALTLISALSEGYPHFIQQFSHSAFASDEDYNITEEDVMDGAFSENGAMDQLAKRYYNKMYFEQIWSEDYRRVLHAMTEYLDQWVSRAQIIKSSGIKETQVNNALAALKTRGIILANEQKKGEYRLPTKAFAVWLKIKSDKPMSVKSAAQP
ncbi:MAG: hypothetical protein P4L87_17295 [Formivibrio sp.]|nr:hypothetical protein [Formivibrio sp.]